MSWAHSAGLSSFRSRMASGSSCMSTPQCRYSRLAVGFHEEVNRHSDSDQHHKSSHPSLRQPLSVVSAKISSCNETDHHQYRLRPVDDLCDYKHQHGWPVDSGAQYCLEGIHGVNVGHAKSA